VANRLALLLLAAALAALPLAAQPQPPQPRPPAYPQPPAYTGGVGQAVAPPVPVGVPVFNPAGYVPAQIYNQGAYGGYLNGAANVTTANAQYQQTIQQAKITRQQAVQESLRTRRATIEERQYEQSLQPDAEKVRQDLIARSIERSMNNPPLAEIWSGKALNAILTAVKTARTRGVTSGPMIPLTPDVVQHINVTGGTTFAGIGIFKEGGKLTWPFALKQPLYKDERAKIDMLVTVAVQQAPSGEVSVEVLNQLKTAVDQLADTVDGAAVQDMTPTDVVLSTRFVRDLRQGMKVLQSNDVAKYFSPKGTAQGRTVDELLGHMIDNGLTFAPAVSGDQQYYTVLHYNMVTYLTGQGRVAAAGPSQSGGPRQ
jgi:hypothetical protein